MSLKRNLVEIRYLGFDQRENSRVYRFHVHTGGRSMKQVSVTADMVVFRDHRVGIQEGPFLSGNKLTADLGRGWEGDHELTAADVRAHSEAKALAGAERANARKSPRRRTGERAGLPQQKSPRGNFGVIVANAVCRTQRLFLHGVLDKNERPGERRRLAIGMVRGTPEFW